MRKCLLGLIACALLLVMPFEASAVISLQDGDIKLDGFLRTWTQISTGGGRPGLAAGNFANFRGTIQIEGAFRFAENTSLYTIFRGSKEALGNWTDRRDDGGSNIPKDWFDEDFSDCVREVFLEVTYPGLTIRAGRQQVIWGETDFFRAADVINPIDYSWRSFLEDWQDIRIPNWMLNVVGNIPECWLGGIGGQVQLIWKPGLDDADDVVDKYGPSDPGRPGAPWAVRYPPLPDNIRLNIGANYPGKGLRNGTVAGRYVNEFTALKRIWNWSLIYQYGWQETPVVSVEGFEFGVPISTVNVIYKWPRINISGATLNTSIDELESVLRVEFSFQRNRGYGIEGGKSSPDVAAAHPKGFLFKDMIRYSVGWDWTPSQWWTKWGSRQAWMYSIQLFQDVILDYDRDEWMQRVAGSSVPRHSEVDTVLTFFCNGHYWSDRIQPGFAAGWHQSGSWMFIPSCTFTPGDHWRAKIEWDAFTGKPYNFIGYSSWSKIACFKLTYQF